MNRPIVPIVLSGGGGTRLWPLSRPDRPKQLLPLVSDRTLLQETLARLEGVGLPVVPPILVCNAQHRTAVMEQMHALGVTPAALVLEPVGRNSAPAVAVAALLAQRAAGAGTDPLLLVLPSDHAIADRGAFAAALRAAAVPAERGRLVTFGIVPGEAATGFGYIRCGQNRGEWSDVAAFVEKPDSATAQRYVESGEYLWNSGMFLFAASAWLAELRTHSPSVLDACERVLAASGHVDGVVSLDEAFAACPSISIDYAVMEKTSNAAVVPLDAGWSDVGSWAALHDIAAKDASGNATQGDVLLRACRDTYVVAGNRTVAVIGVQGVVVVETDDAVLVVAREHAQAVKEVAETLAKRSTGDGSSGA